MADFGVMHKALRDLDPIHGLDHIFLKVTNEGLRWVPNPPSPSAIGLSKEQCLELYGYMKRSRMIDDLIQKLSLQGVALGKHLKSSGNEASAVGASFALQKQDWTFPAIRDMGAFLVRGMKPEQIIAQACGHMISPTAGWDASLHMADPAKHLIGLISPLGTMPCVATGAAFSEIFLKQNGVALVFCGDGTTSQGDTHEALNLASVLRLPFVLVVENNQFGFGTPVQLQYKAPTISLSAYGCDADGCWVDGTNVLAVYAVVKEAVRRAREERRMTIIETISMRYEGHSLADSNEYVPKEQLVLWKEKDPLRTFPLLLVREGIAKEEDFTAIDSRIKTELDAAEDAVKISPYPEAREIEKRVFAPSPSHPIVFDEPPQEGKHITYHKAIQEAIWEEMERNEKLFLIGEDIGVSGGAFKITKGFLEHFDGLKWEDFWNTKKNFEERRVIDAPLSEAGFSGLACGAALAGLSAIVEFQYGDFALAAMTMIAQYAATHHARNYGPLPIVFRMPSGWAKSTGPFHSLNPESIFAGIPGLKIVAPITAHDAKGLLKAAIRDNNPVLFLEYKEHYRERPESLPPELNCAIPEGDYVVPIGKARILKNGEHLTLISYGSQVFRALEAAHTMEQESADTISIEVIDLRSLIPWDLETLCRSVKKTGKAMITCEAPRQGCFGQTIAHELQEAAFRFLDSPVRLVAAANTPVPFAPTLQDAHLPTAEKIAAAIRELLAF